MGTSSSNEYAPVPGGEHASSLRPSSRRVSARQDRRIVCADPPQKRMSMLQRTSMIQGDELPSGVSDEEFNAHIAAGKAMDALLMQAKGTCYIEQGSVYGAAVALPQFARTSGWSVHYTALAIRSYAFLLANILLQGFLVYMIAKEERINDKFGLQMHLCNFGAGLPNCPEGPDCIGPRGTSYTPERLYDWEMWRSRTFIRDSLAALFPERLDEINKLVDPGEYGLESYWLRLACCFLFVMGLWPDLVGSMHLLNLLWQVPTAHESWMLYLGSPPDPTENAGLAPSEEINNVKFRVAGMPAHWKFFNALFVAFPKILLWLLMVDMGTLFLMETAGIEDMIMNAVALSFILSIDELICASLFSDTSKNMLEHIEPLPLFEAAVFEDDRDVWERHQIRRRWNIFSFELYNQIFSVRLFSMIGATAFFQVKYFREHCEHQEDGSWVAKTLREPLSDTLSFWHFIFGPLPNFMSIPSTDEILWHAAGRNYSGRE